MESRSLYHLADVTLSRGAVPNHRFESALTSPTPSIAADSTERLPEPQHLRLYRSMPHIDTNFQQNGVAAVTQSCVGAYSNPSSPGVARYATPISTRTALG